MKPDSNKLISNAFHSLTPAVISITFNIQLKLDEEPNYKSKYCFNNEKVIEKHTKMMDLFIRQHIGLTRYNINSELHKNLNC